MKMKNLLVAFAVLFGAGLIAQEGSGPTDVIVGTFLGETMPLRDYAKLESDPTRTIQELKIVANGRRSNEQTNPNALPSGEDPLRQEDFGDQYRFALEQNFDGGFSSESGFIPPDPTGAVGPNHYVHAFNSAVKIFDKSGTLLVGPVALGTFLGNGMNNGDPIVMYDQLADRFFVSQFGTANPSAPTNTLVIGVSTTNDPTGTYNVYTFTFGGFPDYPHYTVWPDGYYLTANKLGGDANRVYVMERDVILAGGPSPQIVGFPLPGIVFNPNTIESPEPANLLGTTFPANVPGYITFLQDDGWSGVSFDHLKVWEIDVDWGTIGNSMISAPLEIPVAEFNSTFSPFGQGDVNQPGTSQKIDMQGGIISYAANYRSFATHNSWVITFNVDVDLANTSGVRWVELRNNAVDSWTVYQEGTYAPDDGHSRFMGSAAMDELGNIGMGFNIASAELRAGIRFTGRFNGDPLGEMTQAEQVIVEGNGVQTFSNRFGDYSHLSMDPNGTTFWHTAQYFASINNWRTRIASFSLSTQLANDVGVDNIIEPNDGELTATETVDISIRNFGLAPQTNIPLELYLDGNLVASETFTGVIAPNEAGSYTFTATVDLSEPNQTYELEARTVLTGDQLAVNDAFVKEVENITLGIDDFATEDSKLIITSSAKNQYNILLKSQYEGVAYIAVYNTLGQQMGVKTVQNEGGEFRLKLDMSYASSGVYIVKVGGLTSNGYKSAKIIVE